VTKRRGVLRPVNSISRLLSSEAKSYCEKFGGGCKNNGSFGVQTENHKPLKTFEEAAVNHTMPKGAAVAADKENCGLKLFKKVSVNQRVPNNLGTNSPIHGPVKTCSSQTSKDSGRAHLTQTAADPVFSTAYQSTRCSETMLASSRHFGESLSEVETEIGRLSVGLSATELQRVHSQVFCRR